ncbi:MAG: response regulator [Candidatus Krumholzibacteriales bacterium]
MGNGEKKVVMIVDDNVELLEELSELLSGSGYRIITFSNGSEALDHARNSPPDLILLDLKMDGKSGFSVAQELGHRTETSSIPILGMTGYYTGHMYATLMSIIGFRGCMTKPLDPERLLSRISELLEDGDERFRVNDDGNGLNPSEREV